MAELSSGELRLTFTTARCRYLITDRWPIGYNNFTYKVITHWCVEMIVLQSIVTFGKFIAE